MFEKSHPFDCPYCDSETQYRTKIGGAIAVGWHMHQKHPDITEDVGNPFSDREAPEFEDGKGIEGDPEVVESGEEATS